VEHTPVLLDELRGGNPDPDSLRIDMYGQIGSDWNTKLIDILQARYHSMLSDLDLTPRSDAYLREILRDKIARLRTTWKRYQSRMLPDGSLETPEALEVRIVNTAKSQSTATRHRSRRARVCFSFLRCPLYLMYLTEV
jgi:hypothetical protein